MYYQRASFEEKEEVGMLTQSAVGGTREKPELIKVMLKFRGAKPQDGSGHEEMMSHFL